MSKIIRLLALFEAVLLITSGCSKNEPEIRDYPIMPVPFTSVRLTDNFWAPRVKKNADVTIPIAFHHCEITGRVRNFEIAAGLEEGKFQTIYPFDDSDVFKIIEGAGYSLQTLPDSKLEAYLDALIYKIGLAQEEDGYLYTNRTIAEKNGGEGLHEWAHEKRWLNDSILSHELYNLGHLYEAAAAHYQATGKRSLLDIALKSADLVIRDIGWDRLKVYPGHQVIEMGLVKLYRITGEKKYLDMARFFLDYRGPGGEQYCQAHLKVTDQDKAVGHSVRATYMYSGMADIAAIEKDTNYLRAITKIWEDLVHTKMYLTGGIGASGGNEGFAEPYVLPNMSAYCETCASIGDIFFNHRLFLLHGESKYIDVLEKTLYNSMLSGVSLSADRFFYPNPLESDGQHNRSPWFGCACCPSNVARFIPAIPGYVYATKGDTVFVNLYISGEAEIALGNDTIKLVQKSDYPWDGKIIMVIKPEKKKKFSMKFRIPGWAGNEAIPGNLYRFTDKHTDKIILSINGEEVESETEDGYVTITRKWYPGDKVEFGFSMMPRKIIADQRVWACGNKIALQRGPLIYCAEWPDNNTGSILNMMVDEGAIFTEDIDSSLSDGAVVLRATGYQTKRNLRGGVDRMKEEPLKLIPYYLWNNRGPGQMMVWLPVSESVTRPLPAPTLAFTSTIRASKPAESYRAVFDQIIPLYPGDRSPSNFNWWPKRNQWEFIEYDFQKPERISKAKVYWFDDGPDGGCRVPAEWEVLYLNGNIWEPVKARNRYKITKDGLDSLMFDPVVTSSVKLKILMNRNYSAGVFEWISE
jgi:uncharacterized protein